MSKRARWAVAGVSVLGVAMALWLLLGGGVGELDAFSRADDGAAFLAEDALTAEGEAAEDGRASLEGRTVVRDPNAPVPIGDVEVLVVGPTGVPLPDVLIEAIPPAPKEGEPRLDPMRATTVEDGTTEFSQLPYDGSWTVALVMKSQESVWISTVRLSGDAFVLEAQKPPSAPVMGPRVKLVLRQGVPMDIAVVGADTGFAFEPGPWAVRPDIARDSVVLMTQTPVKPVAITPGNDASVTVFLPEFADYVHADDGAFETWVSPRATSLHAEVPLRREGGVLVGVPDGVELTADTDWKVTYVVGGRLKGKAHAVADAYGRIRVRGVPFLRGEPVVLKGEVRDEGIMQASGTFDGDGRDDLFLEATWQPYDKRQQKTLAKRQQVEEMTRLIQMKMAATAEKAQELVVARAKAAGDAAMIQVQLIGPDGEVVRGRIHSTGEPTSEPNAADDLKGAVRIEIFTPRGKPAAGAVATLGKTRVVADSQGVAWFKGLASKEYPLQVVGAGASFTDTVEVFPKQTTRLEKIAPEGGKIDLEVVDEFGDPLPFATVKVLQESGLPYADVEAGVQRVDPFTDHRGRRLLAGVEPGRVKLEIQYGRRRLVLEVLVVDADTVAARAILAVSLAETEKELRTALDGSEAGLKDALLDAKERAKMVQERAKLVEALNALQKAREAAAAAESKGK